MNDNPHSPDFDWVTARLECSLANEFVRLKALVKANYEARMSHLRKEYPVTFSFSENGEREFSVTRKPKEGKFGGSYKVDFSLRHELIHVESEWDDKNRARELTLTLNDNGECRFKLDEDDKEYLRWQIARRALGSMFFDGPKNRSPC